MKILTVIENYPPYVVGGAELVAESYIDYVSPNTHVDYLVLTGSQTKVKNFKEYKGVIRSLEGVDNQTTNTFLSLLKMVWNIFVYFYVLLTFRPNLVEFVPNNHTLYPLMYVTTLIKQPMVISVHNSVFANEVRSIGNWINRIKHKVIQHLNTTNETRVLTISKFIKKGLLQAGFKANTIAIFNNPILVNYSPLPARNYAVFASRLIEEKGVKQVLDAFSKIKCVELYIYGDGEEKKLVKEYVKKFKNIKYFGQVSETDIFESVRNCFCIIAHPIFEEPYGRYIVHSLATLKPLICSISGAVPEIITNGKNGLLVKKGDTKAIIESVKKLKSDSKLYQKIVSNLEKDRINFAMSLIGEKRINLLTKLTS